VGKRKGATKAEEGNCGITKGMKNLVGSRAGRKKYPEVPILWIGGDKSREKVNI